MIKAIKVDDIRSAAGEQAGAVEFRSLGGEVQGIAFRCPCGCGHEAWLPVGTDETTWQYNGDETSPSLTPSVLQSGLPCKWHGYLIDGHWVDC